MEVLEKTTFYKLVEEYNAMVKEYFETKDMLLYKKIEEMQIKIGGFKED